MLAFCLIILEPLFYGYQKTEIKRSTWRSVIRGTCIVLIFLFTSFNCQFIAYTNSLGVRRRSQTRIDVRKGYSIYGIERYGSKRDSNIEYVDSKNFILQRHCCFCFLKGHVVKTIKSALPVSVSLFRAQQSLH